MKRPAHQSIFTDFDYDYIALGNQLGEGWTDTAWKNDTCPRFSIVVDEASDTWYDLWFDYQDPKKSEHLDGRALGELCQFELCDQYGNQVVSTDNWDEMLAKIKAGVVQEHFNNAQEKRATDTDG